MAEKASSFRAAGRRRGRPRHARGIAAVIVAAAVIAVAGTACTPAPSGPAAHGLTSTPPAVTVLKQGADNGNGDIFIAPEGGGSAGGPEITQSHGTAGLAACFRGRVRRVRLLVRLGCLDGQSRSGRWLAS
jgi:hypothetical protein